MYEFALAFKKNGVHERYPVWMSTFEVACIDSWVATITNALIGGIVILGIQNLNGTKLAAENKRK